MSAQPTWEDVVRLWTESGIEGSPWRPGMLLVDPHGPMAARLLSARGGLRVVEPLRHPSEWYPEDCAPDPNDPATLGCLDDVARGLHGGRLVVMKGDGWWSVEIDTHRWDCDNTASLYDALIAAIVAGLSR